MLIPWDFHDAVIESTQWCSTVAILTVRNVPDEVHRALRMRAAQHGRSTEAEVREILASAVKPEKRVRMGDALGAPCRKVGLTDEDIALSEHARDKTSAKPLSFG